MTTGECALCRAQAGLCESHILPRFLVDVMRDSKSRINVFDPRPREVPNTTPKTPAAMATSRQLWEYMLCEACEGRFNRKETCVAPLYRDWVASPDRLAACQAVLPRARERWADLKYLILSIFWRLSVADRWETKSLKLAPDAEESLRLLLLEQPCSHRWELTLHFVDPWEAWEGTDTAEVAHDDPLTAYWMAAGGLWGLHRDPNPEIPVLTAGLTPPWSVVRLENIPGMEIYRELDRTKLPFYTQR